MGFFFTTITNNNNKSEEQAQLDLSSSGVSQLSNVASEGKGVESICN